MKLFQALFILLLIGSPVAAAMPPQAGNLTIDHMEIDIWPDYDQPSVLVIFRISFSSRMNFPAWVSLRIPATAGNPYSVAMKDIDGLLYDLEYSVIPDGEWNRIEFVTSSQDLQIEFYEPYELLPNYDKNYNFSWISDYPANLVTVSIQKPKYSSDMLIVPDAGEASINPDDGLFYYSLSFPLIEQGSTIEVAISYSKTNEILSASTVPVNSVVTLPEKRSVWQALSEVFPYIWGNTNLLIAGVLLLGGLVIFNFLLAIVWVPKTRRYDKRIRTSSTSGHSGQKKNEEDTAVYCHHCGKRAKPGDAFCRICGSKLVE